MGAVIQNGNIGAIIQNGIVYGGTVIESGANLEDLDVEIENLFNGNISGQGTPQCGLYINSITDTDVKKTIFTYTATKDCLVCISTNSKAKTNTGSNEGYVNIEINNVQQWKEYLTTDTNINLSDIPSSFQLSANDVLKINFGFDNAHTNCWCVMWTNIVIISVAEPTPPTPSGADGYTYDVSVDSDYNLAIIEYNNGVQSQSITVSDSDLNNNPVTFGDLILTYESSPDDIYVIKPNAAGGKSIKYEDTVYSGDTTALTLPSYTMTDPDPHPILIGWIE